MSQNTDNRFDSFLRDSILILGSAGIENADRSTHIASDNSLGVPRPVMGILRPESLDQVVQILKLAILHQVQLHPISRGQNIGYGELLPSGDHQFVLDLGKLTSIHLIDRENGILSIEPGVTQKMLYDFVRSNLPEWWMDVTGAGLNASIIGNTLEGGFGHTPKGNHRQEISCLTVLTGNGDLLKTGVFPGIGPDLSGIFVHSNFGIVLQMRVELFPAPEKYVSFVIKAFQKDDVKPLAEIISRLRHRGTLTSLVHIANSVRSMVSVGKCPSEFKQKVMTAEDAIKALSSPLVRVGHWTALGGLYGTKAEVNAKIHALKRTLDSRFEVMFFTEKKIKFLERLVFSKIFDRIPFFSKIRGSVEGMKYVHGLGMGIPSDEAFSNIQWRVEDKKNLGLIWCSPTLPAKTEAIDQLLKICDSVFKEYPFEFPLTMTLVKPDMIVGVISITFDKSDEQQKELAHQLYFKLKQKLNENGIGLYRSAILGMDQIGYDPVMIKTLNSLKSVLDSSGVIAKGRYGIR